MPLCSAITLMVVPLISPVSENARLAAARIELFLASAVSRRRTGGVPSADRAGAREVAALTVRVLGLVTGYRQRGRLAP
jgi:hypothetical protein